jgi:aspartate kinase
VAIIVQKFGGTSVGSLERIQAVADKVIDTVQQGHQVVVVLSAMAGETNRLLAMAKALDEQPAKRELDMLLASGEQVSISLLSIALIQRGHSSISLLADQIGLKTDNRFGKARITGVANNRLLDELNQGHIVIVAGFQGVDNEGNITTLGRGGSDTSAVAVAAAIDAAECQIFTDVNGVYTTDPRVEPNAQRLPFVTFDEMLELASLGAKVLQIRAVEYAGKHGVPIRVLSSFESGEGTVIGDKDNSGSDYFNQGETHAERPVSGITFKRDEAMVSITGLPLAQHVSAELFTLLGEQGVEVDMIVQNVIEDNLVNIIFTVDRDDYQITCKSLQQINKKYTLATVQGDDKVVKISAVGNGMKSHAGVAGKMFSALAKENIQIKLISTSEIKVSVLVEEKYLELAVRALHSVFELDAKL